MRRFLWAVGLALACVQSASVSAQTLAGTDDEGGLTAATTAVATVPTTNAAAALLSKRVESIDWIERTFEEVIDFLREQGEGQVNIVPRWTQLAIDNVGPEALVTLRLNNTTVADVLDETLEQLNDEGQLGYRAIGNTLRISTRTDFDRKYYVRVYNVTDILFRVPDFQRSAPAIDLQNTNQQRGGGGQGGGGGGGRGVFGQGGSRGNEQLMGGNEEQAFGQQMEGLRQVITTVIAPETWEGEGGGNGRIASFNRSLIVYQTIEVHEQIAGYFYMYQ